MKSPARVLILLILGTQLPFLFQAFHIDDRIYLRVADNILEKPLYPYDFRISFEGMGAPDGASHSHLPLVSYYLALLKWVTQSESEWVFHLGFLVFPVLAAWGFYDLARRYVRFPLAASCLLVTAPGFLVSSHTVMTDVPFWSLWIVALSRFLRVRDGTASRWDWLIWGASLLGTCFISVLGAGLMLLMLVCLFLRESGAPRISRGKTLLVLASPLLLWGLWYLRAYLHYDRFLLLNTALHALGRDIYSGWIMGEKALSLLLNLGGTVIFPVALWYGLAGRVGARVLAVLFLLSFVPFYLWREDWTWSQILLFSLFLSSGVAVFWRFLSGCGSDLLYRRDWRWLPIWLWFFGGCLACLLMYYSGSVRYSTLVAGPVILLWIAALENRVKEAYLLRNLVWLGVVLTALYSLTIAHADYRFARSYQQAAQEIAQDYGQEGKTIWFTAEWGFRYYLEREGATILERTEAGPKTGDILVKPAMASPWVTLYDSDEYVDLLEQRPARMNTPWRILDLSSHAGFYSTGWGILPVSITGGEPWEWFNVFRVKKPYDGPVPEPATHW